MAIPDTNKPARTATDDALDGLRSKLRGDVPAPSRTETSVHAHLVTSVAITMSTAEMDGLVTVLRRVYESERYDWTPTERAIVEDTLNAIETVR